MTPYIPYTVYALLDSRGVFYVGKTKLKNRLGAHISSARTFNHCKKRAGECLKCARIRSSISQGDEICLYPIAQFQSNEAALEAEQRFVDFFGRENLLNMGHPDEVRDRLLRANLKETRSPESFERRSKASSRTMKARWLSPGYREQLRASLKAKAQKSKPR